MIVLHKDILLKDIYYDQLITFIWIRKMAISRDDHVIILLKHYECSTILSPVVVFSSSLKCVRDRLYLFLAQAARGMVFG